MKILLAGVLLCSTVNAGTLGIHMGSYHDRSGYNNFNPGIYYKTDSGLVAGTFRNSQYNQTLYTGYAYEHGPFAIIAGVATGYTHRPVVPMIVPSVSYKGFRLSLVPNIKHVTDVTTFHISYEFSSK